MKETKDQKGITLIALIITIVILLILAAVAISSIKDNSILQYATNAATDYNGAVTNEQGTLQDYEDYLTGATLGYKSYTVGQEIKMLGESFYVIKDSPITEEKVVLLAKNCINTSTFTQTSNPNKTTFAQTRYWEDTYGINIIETGVPATTNYAAYAAYMYAKKFDESATGRLLYWYDEAEVLDASNRNMIRGLGKSYWMGSYNGTDCVIYVSDGGTIMAVEDSPNAFNSQECSVRPVIEISKSKLNSIGTGVPELETAQIGQEVKIGEERFYVIRDCAKTDENILLLSKYCLDTADSTNLVQSSTDADNVAFAVTKYWTSGDNENIVEVPSNQTYAANIAARYGSKLGGNGRLLYWFDEAEDLDDTISNIIRGENYWMGSYNSADYVIYVSGGVIKAIEDSPNLFTDVSAGVRPVVEIEKSKVTLVIE